MNKFYIIIFLILSLTGQSLAQLGPSVTISKPYPYVESGKKFYVADKTGFLLIKVLAKKLILQKIDFDLTLYKAMQYESFPKDFSVEEVLVLKGKCYIVYTATTKGLPGLFMAQVDVAKGELIDLGKEFVSPSNEIDSYQFLFSDDSSYFAVCYKLKSNMLKSKNHEVNGVWIFNDQLSEHWHAEFTLPYTEKKCTVRRRGIDTDGNFHLALTVIRDESGLEKKTGQTAPNYSIELFSYQSPSEPPQVTNFNLEEKFLNSIFFSGSGHKLICSGFYNSGKGWEKDRDPEGIFFANLSTQTSSAPTFISFPLSTVNEGEKNQKQRTNEKLAAKGMPLQIEGLHIDQVIHQADSGLLLLGEQHKQITAGGYYGASGIGGAPVSSSGTTSDVYNNIIVIKLLPDGKLKWVRKLFKNSSFERKVYLYQQKDSIHNFLFIEGNQLFEYRLNGVTGEGEKKAIIDFKPLLKRPQSIFNFTLDRPILLPKGNGILVEAFLSGDAGQFGESKRYKEQVLVKVTLD